MTTNLLLYRSPVSARQQMAGATPEQAPAGICLDGLGRHGRIRNHRPREPAPPGDTVGATSSDDTIGGYSLMEAGSVEKLRGLLEAHPHLQQDGTSIDVLEVLRMPGP